MFTDECYCQVCVYDRAGLGWSEAAPRMNMSDPGEAAVARTLGPEATGLRMVSDLHRLITFANPQERPLVLVGLFWKLLKYEQGWWSESVCGGRNEKSVCNYGSSCGCSNIGASVV